MGKRSRAERTAQIRSMSGLSVLQAKLQADSMVPKRAIDWAAVITATIVFAVILAHALS